MQSIIALSHRPQSADQERHLQVGGMGGSTVIARMALNLSNPTHRVEIAYNTRTTTETKTNRPNPIPPRVPTRTPVHPHTGIVTTECPLAFLRLA